MKKLSGFISVYYEEFETGTYARITLYCGNDKFDFASGDPVLDMNDAFMKAKQLKVDSVGYSSTVETFAGDDDDYDLRLIKGCYRIVPKKVKTLKAYKEYLSSKGKQFCQ